LPFLSKYEGYLRTTRFKLADARANPQSRALKGLSTTDEPAPTPPVWLALHEFEVDDVDMGKIKELTTSPWTTKIHQNRKEAKFNTYRLVAEFGEKDWFHGVGL
jgi:hypothetical protein